MSVVETLEPGARWLRCDLHVHTPFDPERTFGENVKHAIDAFKKEKPEKLAEIAGRFITACREGANGEGIDLVALTDHNSIDGYRYLKPLFAAIAQQSQNENLSMPVVLPGVEFSVGGERPIHFLAIFALDTDPDEIDGVIHHVFGSSEPFDPRAGSPRATGNSVDSFLKNLYDYCHPSSGDRRLSFVLIPAHADSSRGVATETGGDQIAVATSIWDEMKGHLRQWVITRQDWNGFQTLRSYSELPEAFRNLLARWFAERRGTTWDDLSERDRNRIRSLERWPLIECSDPHQYEGIGARYSWLKMEIPDVEGIRLALLDPESRLRRMAEGKPAHSYPVISRVSIRDTDFFEDITLNLNPCLNTIIGGRGSGKSTVIEYIRYALDRARSDDFDEDEDETREAVEAFLTPKQERDYGETPGTLLPGHEIVLEIEVAGTVYRIIRSAEGESVVSLPHEEPLLTDLRTLVSSRFLSQRQIARIARDPTAQRRELDALADPAETRSFSNSTRELLGILAQSQTERRTLQMRAATLPARETELRTITGKIAFLEKGGNEDILSRFRSFQEEERWLDQVKELLDSASSDLTTWLSDTAEGVNDLDTPPEGPSSEWTSSIAQKIGQAITDAHTTVTTTVSDLQKLLEALSAEISTKWDPEFSKAREDYEQLKREMVERGVDFSQHEGLVRRRIELEAEIEELKTIANDLAKVEDSIASTRLSLLRNREGILELRRNLAANLERQDADVRLDVIAFGDRGDFEDRRDEWFGGAGLQERDWTVLADYVFSKSELVPDRLHELVKAIRADITATLEATRPLELTSSAIGSLLDKKAKLTRNFFNALQRGQRIHLDELERFFPEDRIVARVRGVDGSFKPIEQGSIGQKSTAILALLLSAGDQPLIIDQPEDDLDNQYIYDVVVDLLRKRKFSRQIVMATHNANIPVNGDAELIVALEVKNQLGEMLTSGSIDRSDVKDAVTAIMEGSAEAFRLRRERYGY